jgi:hypothetical protein
MAGVEFDRLKELDGKRVYCSPTRQDLCLVHGSYLVEVVLRAVGPDEVFLVRGGERLKAEEIRNNLFFEVTR